MPRSKQKKLHCPSPILPCRHHFRIVVTRRRAVHSWCVDQIWQPALGLLWVLRVRIILGNRCGKTRTSVGTSFVCRRVVVRVPARVPAGGPAAHTTRTSWYEWYAFALSSGIVVVKLVPVLVRVWSITARSSTAAIAG